MKLNEVLKFIKNCNEEDLDLIQDVYNAKRITLRNDQKSQFGVGDKVKINHKTVSPNLLFEITKINRKNIKVVCTDNKFKSYSVSPSLLEKIK
jgi:hypothetical protein